MAVDGLARIARADTASRALHHHRMIRYRDTPPPVAASEGINRTLPARREGQGLSQLGSDC